MRPAAWAPGAVVGEHRLGERLGQGGMGEVHLGEHLTTGARHAIKSLPGSADRDLLLRFQREVEALARVDRHPHVIRVHSAGEALGRRYLVMDLAPGGDLQGRVEARGPLAPEDAVALGVALASGLSHAHARGILHRDLKPHNVLFDGPAPGGRPLLVDFGLARDVDARSLTATGELVGTPAYMAPEQADGDRGAVGPWTDVYGLAATLFHALTGRPPFEGGSTLATLSKVLSGPAPSARALAPAVPPALDAVLRHAMARAPAERYPTADAFARALEASLVAPSRRPRLLLAAAVVTLATATGLVLTRRPPTPALPPPPGPAPAPAAPDLPASGDGLAPGDLDGPLDGLGLDALDGVSARLAARMAALAEREQTLGVASASDREGRRGSDAQRAALERSAVGRLRHDLASRARDVATARQAEVAREAASQTEVPWLEDPPPGAPPVRGEATVATDRPLAAIVPTDLKAAPPRWLSDPLRQAWLRACATGGAQAEAANVARLLQLTSELETRRAAAGWWRLVAVPVRAEGGPARKTLEGEAWTALGQSFSGGYGLAYDAPAALACLKNGEACGNPLARALLVEARVEGYYGLLPIPSAATAAEAVVEVCRDLQPDAEQYLQGHVALLAAARLRTAPARLQDELRDAIRRAAAAYGDEWPSEESRLELALLRDAAPGTPPDERRTGLDSIARKTAAIAGAPASSRWTARLARRLHAEALALLSKLPGGTEEERRAARAELEACASRDLDSELVLARLLLREQAPGARADALRRLAHIASRDPREEGDAVHEARTLLHVQTASSQGAADPDPEARRLEALVLESADAGWLPARRCLRPRASSESAPGPR